VTSDNRRELPEPHFLWRENRRADDTDALKVDAVILR
jgi:hypothetical protein